MISTSAMSGTFGQHVLAVGEQRRGHQLEHRVLRARARSPRPCSGPDSMHDDLLVWLGGAAVGSASGERTWPPSMAAVTLSSCSGHPPTRSLVARWTRRSRLGRPATRIVAERADGDDRSCRPTGRSPSTTATLHVEGDRLVDTTTYRLAVPWFGWLFRWPVRSALRTRGTGRRHAAGVGAARPAERRTTRRCSACWPRRRCRRRSSTRCSPRPSTSPPTTSASASAGRASPASIVRCGIVIALPFMFLADRVGRRRMIVLLAWLAPICASLGALAPNFWVLTATQTVGAPARHRARSADRRRRGRGDAAQQPRLRGQRAGDGERARRRGRGDGAAARRRRRLAARLRRLAGVAARRAWT